MRKVTEKLLCPKLRRDARIVNQDLYRPGEACNVKTRQDIRETTRVQLLVLLGCMAYPFLTISAFNENFNKQPYDLFGSTTSSLPR